jgi:hypothetical protein
VLLALRRSVVGQRKINVAGKRAGLTGKALEKRLCLVQLFVGQARGGGTNACGGLDRLDFQRLPFSGSFGAGREVFSNALTVKPAGKAKNDLP